MTDYTGQLAGAVVRTVDTEEARKLSYILTH
jgi:hypothetical protein